MLDKENVKLGLIDRLRVLLKRREAEKLEDERLKLEPNGEYHPDYSEADKLEEELRAKKLAKLQAKQQRKMARLNKKMGVQSLEPAKAEEKEVKPLLEVIDEMNKNTLDFMLNKPLKSKEDAYENIIEMQRYLSYPHDDIPNAVESINSKYAAIAEHFGQDALEKGMKCAEIDEGLIEMYEVMPIKQRVQMEDRIMRDGKLAETLNELRYQPEKSENLTGEIVLYRAVYAHMVAGQREAENYQAEEKQEEKPKQNNFEKSEEGYKEVPYTLNYIKVSPETIKSMREQILEEDKKTLDAMLDKPLKSKEDAYENIIEMQRYLSYPHDDIPNAVESINSKYAAIAEHFGQDALEKGMKCAEIDEGLIEMYEVMPIKQRVQMEDRIMRDGKLAETLNELRYQPEKSENLTGEIVLYQAVYAHMVAQMKDEQNRGLEQNEAMQGESLHEQLM